MKRLVVCAALLLAGCGAAPTSAPDTAPRPGCIHHHSHRQLQNALQGDTK